MEKQTVILGTILLMASMLLMGCLDDQNTKGTSMEDCGTTDILASVSQSEITEVNAEDDETLMCMGNSFVDNCSPSRSIIETSNAGDIKFKIDKGPAGKCLIRLEYGSKDQIPSEDHKKFADGYVQCPLDMKNIQAETKSGVEEKPGSTALTLYGMTPFMSMNPQSNCTGPVIEKYGGGGTMPFLPPSH